MKSPVHIAIIMDGNGRWANLKKQSRSYGHKVGAEMIKPIALYCQKIGVLYLTLYAFSIENWRRKEEEITNLFDLMRHYFSIDINELIESNIRIIFIGSHENLPQDIILLMDKVMFLSRFGTFNLIFAINYGSRQEISQALKACIMNNDIDNIERYLYTSQYGIPDPDLLIRTGGDQRISNFLLWQLAYTELFFIKKYWPEIKVNDIDIAIQEFNTRIRKYGK